jgi:hypothetical protein
MVTTTQYEFLTAYQYRDAYSYNYESMAILLTGDEVPEVVFNNLPPLKNSHAVDKFYKEYKKDGMYPNVNIDFDINFPCVRSNDAEFRLLFTPLAQKEIINLVVAQRHAYTVNKSKNINIALSHFANELSTAFDSSLLVQYDFEVLKQVFHDFTFNFFKNIYFALAPFLCIPLYQQFGYQKHLNDIKSGISNLEVETFINHIDPHLINHPESDTDNLIRVTSSDDKSHIQQIVSNTFKLIHNMIPTPVRGVHVGTRIINVPITEFHPRSRTTYVSQMPIANSKSDVTNNLIYKTHSFKIFDK